jgi:glyoxylase-like metal-dependent hydrolase (beta-lactamase superfamily II)
MSGGLGEELRPGLRAWTAYHEEWEQEVRGFAVVEPERLVLIDPLLVGEQWEELAALRGERSLDVLLTIHWHARSAAEVRERHPDASVWAYAPGRGEVAERTPVDRAFEPGEELPGGLFAIPALPRTEVVFWDAPHAALITGDVLLGDGELGEGLHLCPESWLHAENGGAALRASLRPVLDLPVELVLTAHGALVLTDGAAALRAAIA